MLLCCLFQNSECSQRLVPCQYCELEIVYSQSKEHEDYCGTRTEPCLHCKCNIMLREKAVHPFLCGNPQPPGSWFEAHSIRNFLHAQERGPKNSNSSAAEQQGFSRPFDHRVSNTSRGSQASEDRKNTAPRNTAFSHCESMTDHELTPDEDSSGLDYLLALSLQSDGESVAGDGDSSLWSSIWDHNITKTSNTSVNAPLSPANNNYPNLTTEDHNTMLPCEFCEELFPEEDLILHQPFNSFSSFEHVTLIFVSDSDITHSEFEIDFNRSCFFSVFQTGCSPASAFASFSKRPASPPKEDRMSRSTSGVLRGLPDTLASNIPTFPRSVSPASYSPPASPLEGDVVIPCEFCGVALEEAVVFHHQDKCDMRPQTSYPLNNLTKPSIKKPQSLGNDTFGQMSPDFQRRIKHQGNVYNLL
uniref:TRAF-type zinc finger domain-containing protein 1 n=1 Tax=Mola mola TaxID=94237 RepID=A0A3Q3XHB5_MOLML